MPPINVLFIWDVEINLRNHFSTQLAIGKFNLIFPDDLSDQNLIQLSKNADVIVGWRPKKELLLSAEKLQLLINPGAGVQHLRELLLETEVRHKKFTLVNGHGNSIATAEGAVALLLAYMNRVVPHHNWMTEGKWRLGDQESKSMILSGRSVGFLGYGHVAKNVTKMLTGFDLKFHALKRNFETREIDGVRFYKDSEIESFFQNIDILIETLPSTPGTLDFVGIKFLELLGENGIVVHVGRGDTINEEALFEVLKTKKIEGAAIDVWYDYDPNEGKDNKRYPYNFPFHELDNVLLSPHRCASPFDDLERWHDVIQNLKIFASGSSDLLNIVNIEQGY